MSGCTPSPPSLTNSGPCGSRRPSTERRPEESLGGQPSRDPWILPDLVRRMPRELPESRAPSPPPRPACKNSSTIRPVLFRYIYLGNNEEGDIVFNLGSGLTSILGAPQIGRLYPSAATVIAPLTFSWSCPRFWTLFKKRRRRWWRCRR